MAYKVLRTGGSVTFRPMWNISLPEGATFSAFSEQPTVGTALMNEDGNLVFTPEGDVTGNTYVSCVASLPSGQDVFATLLIHVTDNTDETTNFGCLSPL